MCWKLTWYIRLGRKMGKRVKYDWQPQEEWRKCGYGFPGILPLWLISPVSHGMGAVSTSHVPLCFLNQTLRTGANISLLPPAIPFFAGFNDSGVPSVGWRGSSPRADSAHVHNTAACSRVCQWVALWSWALNFQVQLNFWQSRRTDHICEAAGCEGSRIEYSLDVSFIFVIPPPLLLAQETLPISLQALGAAFNFWKSSVLSVSWFGHSPDMWIKQAKRARLRWAWQESDQGQGLLPLPSKVPSNQHGVTLRPSVWKCYPFSKPSSQPWPWSPGLEETDPHHSPSLHHVEARITDHHAFHLFA